MTARDLIPLVVVSLLMGALVGYGAARAARHSHGPGLPPTGFGPAGAPGASATRLPDLPPGVTLDEHGVLRGLDHVAEPGTRLLIWDTLRSFEYSKAAGLRDMPEAVRALDGERVTLVGFLMPNYEYDDIRQFALMAVHPACCFGMPLGITGVVNVHLDERHAGLEITAEPLRVVGTFRVREVKESGWLVAIYSLEDAKAEKLR